MSLNDNLKTQFKNKKVLIVGLGLLGGGVGLAKFFFRLGAKVKVTDKKTKEQLLFSLHELRDYDIQFTLGRHDLNDFLESDLIIKAPKMRWDDPLIVAAEKKGVRIDMEASFFAALCPSPIVGVTGTRGKSTTTMMIYEMLKRNAPKRIHLAGNLPEKLAINLLPDVKPDDLVVLELSSWQLSGFHKKKISPHIAVFTNFYPDHYDYYKTNKEYLFDKKAIYLYQKPGDFLVVNSTLENVVKEDKVSKEVYFKAGDFPSKLEYLKGLHNRENAAATLAVGRVLGLDVHKIINTIKSFKGLPYRQQIVAEKNGIVFINDTTSTTPTATEKALDTFAQNPAILLLGGNSKNLPFNTLLSHLAQARKIILLKGSFTDQILPAIKNNLSGIVTEPYEDLEKAVVKAYEEAQKIQQNHNQKIYVLFSPAATSFAMFNNEFHRGDEFNRIVKKIIDENDK